MSKRTAGLWLAVLVAILPCAPVRAVEVVLSEGIHDTDRTLGHGPLEAGLVVRLVDLPVWRFPKWGMVLVPAFGAMATERNAYYFWAGGSLLIPLSSRWGLIPEAGAGVYRRAEAKNLGGTLEFRSGLGVVYRLHEAVRVGFEFYHLSNAGLYELNPGVNSLVFTLGIGRAPAFRSPRRSSGSVHPPR